MIKDIYIYIESMKFKKEKHLLEREPEYALIYDRLLKDEKYWRNNGQYFMARECQRRAYNLLNDNIKEYLDYRKTEDLYCPTKKNKFI